jgi:branched-chain amino acid transport system substrate-binding protein
MSKRNWFVLICIAALLLSACQSSSSTPTDSPIEPYSAPTHEPESTPASIEPTPTNQESIRIAFLDRLDQPEVMDQLEWVKLAIMDFNSETGLKVELMEADSGNGADTAQSAATEIGLERDIYGVVGLSYSSDAIGASIVFQQFALPCISFAQSSILSQVDNTSFFQFSPTSQVEGSETGQLVVRALNAKKAFVIYESGSGQYYQNLYNSFVDAVTSNGGTLIGREPITSETQDFSEVVAKIQSNGADVVFLGTGTVEQAGLLIQEMQTENVSIPVVGYSFFSSSAYSAVAEGDYVISPVPAINELPEASDVIQRYTQMYGDKSISLYGPMAYAATTTMLKAIKRSADSGNLTPQTVAIEISQTNRADSILGTPIAFEADGGLKDSRFYLLKVENGSFKTVAPAQ